MSTSGGGVIAGNPEASSSAKRDLETSNAMQSLAEDSKERREQPQELHTRAKSAQVPRSALQLNMCSGCVGFAR
jgi:hypothetical protein